MWSTPTSTERRRGEGGGAGSRGVRDGGVCGRPAGRGLRLREILPEREGVFPRDDLDRPVRERPVGPRDQRGGGGGADLRAFLPGRAIQHPGLRVADTLPDGPEHRRADRREQGTGDERGGPLSPSGRDRGQGGPVFLRAQYLETGGLAVGRRG